jgi:PAS domain S-box-containing protein
MSAEESLLNLIPAIVWEGDPTTWAFRFVSRPAEQLLGYPVERWLRDPHFWVEHIHPDDREWVLAFCTQKTAEGSPHTLEYRMIAADGRTVWLRDTVRVMSENHRPIRFYGVMVDISDRVRAEEETRRLNVELQRRVKELQDERARLRTIIERVPTGLVIAEAPSGRILIDNPQVQRILRRPLTASRSIEEYAEQEGYHADGRRYRAEEWPLARAIQGEEEIEGEEIEIVRGDGTRGRISVSAAPIRDATGALVAGVVAFQDITERREAERALARLNVDLEERVQRRTRDLEVTNRELEAFIHAVSHDLRAPLRAILGFTQMLLRDEDAPLRDQDRELLDRVDHAGERMGQIIEALLELSTVARGALSRCDVDMSELAEDIVAELRRSSPERDVTVNFTPGMHATVDPRLARVALENLLGNAWKYSGKVETPVITFGVDVVGEERVFHVRDNGAGFDAANASKLFTPFQRYHTATEFEGTGVGLATVHRIVARHGGRVWAESRIGEGATFYFTLPDEDSTRLGPGDGVRTPPTPPATPRPT